VNDEDAYSARKARDRSDVAIEIEFEILIERRVPGVGRSGEQQRVAVRRRSHDRFRREIAAGAGPVLDDERLTEALREPLADQARIGVVDAARRKPGNDAHRPVRESLGPRDARGGRKRGSARGDVEKSTAGRFHGSPLALTRETPAEAAILPIAMIGSSAHPADSLRSEAIPIPVPREGAAISAQERSHNVPAARGPEQTPYEGPT
jgi:hypothetical protein